MIISKYIVVNANPNLPSIILDVIKDDLCRRLLHVREERKQFDTHSGSEDCQRLCLCQHFETFLQPFYEPETPIEAPNGAFFCDIAHSSMAWYLKS
jgi:hypothetical protein